MENRFEKFISAATMILLFVSLFIFGGIVFAQTDVYVGDEDLDVGSEEVQENPAGSESINYETPTNSSVKDIQVQTEKEVPVTPAPTVAQTIKTTPQKAPDAGPKEALIVAVSILVGLAFTTYFLFKKIKKIHS